MRWTKVDEVGAAALDVRCRYQLTSGQHSIDLEAQIYGALRVLLAGTPLALALNHIDDAHPFAYKVVAELESVARKLEETQGTRCRCLNGF